MELLWGMPWRALKPATVLNTLQQQGYRKGDSRLRRQAEGLQALTAAAQSVRQH
jgi:hypothetical protein